jgi:hypothetical protein
MPGMNDTFNTKRVAMYANLGFDVKEPLESLTEHVLAGESTF